MATKRSVLIPLFALLVLVIGSTRAEAQGIGVGVKGGVVYPDFTIENPVQSVDLDNKVGWEAGLFFGGNRTGWFGWQTEINYIQKRVAVPNLALGDTGRIRLDYVQVPVLARINIGTKSKNIFAIYGIAGPSFDVKVNEHTSGFQTPPPDDSFETLDISFMAGAGVEITRLVIEGRYAWGLKQINKNFQSAADLKVNTFALLFGLRLN